MTSMDIDDILADLQPGDPKLSLKVDHDLAKKDVERLKQAWINERTCPGILDFETTLLDRIMERVRKQMEFIEENTIELKGTDIKVKLLIVESELERIKFLIRTYLRTRLAKIDKYTMYIKVNGETEMSKLSENEIEYMERHYIILKELYEQQFLSSIPESLQRLDDTSGGISMIEEPDLDRSVFIRVLEDVAEPVTVGTDQIDLQKNNIYVLRYSVISKYVKSGQVQVV